MDRSSKTATLCQAHSIPCALIKGISDFGDPKGKADIKKHISFVSEKVTETLLYRLFRPPCRGTLRSAPSPLRRRGGSGRRKGFVRAP